MSKNKGIDGDKVVSLYVERGMPATEIARCLGVTKQAIYHHLESRGVDRRDTHSYDLSRLSFDDCYEENADGCWVWTACMSGDYGQFCTNGNMVGAHRYSYAKHCGAIPSGSVVHHICETPSCVNPDHLQAMTFKAHNEHHKPWLARWGHPDGAP